jgi:4-hydroxy-3-polyprenylbenzoate decarboxylase
MGKIYGSRLQGSKVEVSDHERTTFYVLFLENLTNIPFVSAALYEIADRLAPGFVIDVTTSQGLTPWGGTILQVRKRRPSDEGLQRNLLAAAMAINRGLRLAIAVDEDINIYEPEEILWALTSRVNPSTDIIFAQACGQSFQPRDWPHRGRRSPHRGGDGIDAPFRCREARFQRALRRGQVDFTKWFSKEETQVRVTSRIHTLSGRNGLV